jgi:hypothetical protein
VEVRYSRRRHGRAGAGGSSQSGETDARGGFPEAATQRRYPGPGEVQ